MFDCGYQAFGGKPTMFIILSHDMFVISHDITIFVGEIYHYPSLSYDHYVHSIQITIKPHKTDMKLSLNHLKLSFFTMSYPMVSHLFHGFYP